MAAKKKIEIIGEINDLFTTGRGIKALEAKAILEDILDYAVSSFNHSGRAVFGGNGGGLKINLEYSIRGIKELFANISFKILISSTDARSNSRVQLPIDLKFEHNNSDNIMESLKPILNKSIEMSFLVKIESRNADGMVKFKVGSLSFSIAEDVIIINIDSLEPERFLLKGDQIFTSIAVHRPIEF